VLWIDLDQLGQRILQSSAQGHGSSRRHVQIRVFLSGQLGCRIYGSSRLVYYGVLDIQIVFSDEIGDHLFSLSGGGAVADDYDITAKLVYQLLQRTLRSCHIVLRLGRIDRRVGDQLAGPVQNSHLAACPVARIDADDSFVLYRRDHKQVFRILCKHFHRVQLCALRQSVSHLALHRRGDEPLVRIGDGIFQYLNKDGLAVSDHLFFNDAGDLSRLYLHLDLQFLFLLSPVDRQYPVIGHLGDGLAAAVVHVVHCLFFRVRGLCGNHSDAVCLLSDHIGQIGIIGYHLCDDIHCPLDCLCCCGYAFIFTDKISSYVLHASVSLLLGKDHHCQGLQSLFPGLGRSGCFLLFIRFVKIFHPLKHLCLFDLGLQFICQFALFIDESYDLFLALLQTAQIGQPFVQVTQYHVGQSACGFFTVSCNKRYGISIIYKFYCAVHLGCLESELPGKFLYYVHFYLLFTVVSVLR